MPILVVTDLAARGIDIPLLDHVVNYSFPPNPKLFVHRVGRTARQGRSGFALSLVEPEDLPYMVDLHLFLGLPLRDTHHVLRQGRGGGDAHDAAASLPEFASSLSSLPSSLPSASDARGEERKEEAVHTKGQRSSRGEDEEDEDEDEDDEDQEHGSSSRNRNSSESEDDDGENGDEGTQRYEKGFAGALSEKSHGAGAAATVSQRRATFAETPCGYLLEAMAPSMVHFGGLPQSLVDLEVESVQQAIKRDGSGALENLVRVCANAMKQYKRTRPDPSAASIRRGASTPIHAAAAEGRRRCSRRRWQCARRAWAARAAAELRAAVGVRAEAATGPAVATTVGAAAAASRCSSGR